jgi:hypothetical protein
MRIVRSSDALMQRTGEGDAFVYSRHDFTPLHNAINAGKNERAHAAALKAKADEDKKKELYEQFKYTGPKIIDQHYVPTIQNKTKAFLQDVTDSSLKPGGLTDEDRLRFSQTKNDIEYSAQKLNGIKKRLDEEIKSIDQYPDWFDTENMKQDRIKEFHPDPDEKGDVDIKQVKPDAPLNGGKLAKYIKQPVLYKSITNDLRSQVEAGQSRLGDDIQGRETGSLFWKPGPGGKRVVGVSDATIDFYLQHPDVMASAEDTVDQKIQKDAEHLKSLGDTRSIENITSDLSQDKDILVKDHVKKQLENINEVNVRRSLRSASGSGDSEDTTAEGAFIKTLAGLQQQTPEAIKGLPESDVLNDSKVPYLDATNLFQGIKTGEGKDGKAFEPYQVLIDPEKPGTIFIKQTRNDKLVPMSDAAITQFAVSVGNIKGNNLNYKKMMDEGNKLGVFGRNNQFKGSNAATVDPEFNREQAGLAQDVAAEAIDRGGKFKEAIAADKGSWLTDWSESKSKKSAEDINENVFKGASLIYTDDEGQHVMKSPKVEISRGPFGGVTYIVTDDSGGEKEFTQEELSAIADGNSDAGKLVVSRSTVKNKVKKVEDKSDADKPGAFD